MSTFGRGVRYELKEIVVAGTGSEFSALTAPSSSNYFIFINNIFNIRDSCVLKIQRYLSNGSGVRQLVSQMQTSGSGNLQAGYLEHGAAVSIGTVANEYTYSVGDMEYPNRILMPGDVVRYNANTNGLMGIRYQEVYFGGQTNY